MQRQTISILGFGFVGRPLGIKLQQEGFDVRGTTRSPEKLPDLKTAGLDAQLLGLGDSPTELLSSDVVILNIPPFTGQLDWFRSWKWDSKTKLIFLSSTSVYLDLAGIVTEESPLQSELLSQEEFWVQEAFSDFAILRLGGLLGRGRHPGKHLSGRKNASGASRPVNLIHVDDVVGFISTVIAKDLSGIFNVVSDEHQTRKDFYTGFCQRTGLPVPEFLADDVSGKIVSNEKMKGHYQLQYPTLSGTFP